MDFLFIQGMLFNHFYILFSPPILYFCFVFAFNKLFKENRYASLSKNLNNLNQRLINTNWYKQSIGVSANIMLNRLELSIKEAQNQKIKQDMLILIQDRVRGFSRNPLGYLLECSWLIFLGRFYYATRLHIFNNPVSMLTLRTTNMWLYGLIRFINFLSIRRTFAFRFFQGF